MTAAETTTERPGRCLIQVLEVAAECEALGQPLSLYVLGAVTASFADASRLRRQAIAMGLLELVTPAVRNHAMVVRLSPAARRLVPHAPKPREVTERACKRCRQPFRSAGAHNRHCDGCRRWLAANDDGAGF